MTSPRSLDTNILLRYLTGDDPARARRSLALLTRVDGGNDPETDGASGAIRSVLRQAAALSRPTQALAA